MFSQICVNEYPRYSMQTLWFSDSICECIDSQINCFIWKNVHGRGIHLVGCHKIAKPRHQGGLGLQTSRDCNTTLLGKQVWKLLNKDNSLWVDLFSHKYLGGGSILRKTLRQGCSPV